MIKKDKHLIKEVAEKYGEDEILLKRLSDFYWSEVYKILTTTSCSRLKLLNLGTFTRKTWNIEKTIEKYERYLNKYIGSWREEGIRKDLSLLYEMRERVKQENERIKLLKQKRNDYYAMKESEKNNRGVL